jgi:hypothetical protein
VTAVLIIALVVVLIGAAGFLVMRSRPRQDDGMSSFRRHIDALSPEARREVHDRERRHKEGEG